ncbi:hypothetical protein [Trueperella pyogenes]|uniref:hypothetical protein n=1 Tax=Trueperella pyogenes TaxID=1661 RepID=UPI002169B86B|nr:hypothetical protein [Trueperella pyogenes]UVJ55070.1 hypothetical protein M1F27_06460 [Trueperella pyogenes]
MSNKNNRKRAIGALLACTCALSMTACSQQAKPQSSEKRNIVSYDEINKEYKDSVAQLTWPDSYTPPEALEGEDTKLTFQTGYGDTRASLLFECAWEKEWLSNYATDTHRANKAIERLSNVPNMGYMSPQRSDDATRRFFKDYLERAKLGDPSGFQENIDNNCP